MILHRQTSLEMLKIYTFTTTLPSYSPKFDLAPISPQKTAFMKVINELRVTKSKHLSDPFLLDLSGAPETTDHTLLQMSSSCGTFLVFLLLPQPPPQVSRTAYFPGNLSHANDPFKVYIPLILNQ